FRWQRPGAAGSTAPAHQASLKGLLMLRLSILPLLLGGVAGVLGYGMNAPGSGSTPVAPADLVIYGRVWTGDSARPWAQAVAISGEKISAVGDSSTIA